MLTRNQKALNCREEKQIDTGLDSKNFKNVSLQKTAPCEQLCFFFVFK